MCFVLALPVFDIASSFYIFADQVLFHAGMGIRPGKYLFYQIS
jgi:hypothetical protein